MKTGPLGQALSLYPANPSALYSPNSGGGKGEPQPFLPIPCPVIRTLPPPSSTPLPETDS